MRITLIAVAVSLFVVATAGVSVSQTTEDVNLTIVTGARQKYLGFGMGLYRDDDWPRLPESIKEKMCEMLFQYIGVRHIRMWMWMWDGCSSKDDPYCVDYHVPFWIDFLDHAMKFTDTLTLSLGPTGNPSATELYNYAQKYVRLLKAVNNRIQEVNVERQADGKKHLPIVTVTGIANEPDVGGHLTAKQAAELTKWYRRELDREGLDYVKIIAPETSSANYLAMEMLDSIMADNFAWNSLMGFATHSYNESITEAIASKLEPYVIPGHKEYWMTEGAEIGHEGWLDPEPAASTTSRFLADMNRLANVWIFFLGFVSRGSDWGMDFTVNPFSMGGNGNQGTMLMFRREEQDWGYLLKVHYYHQMNQTFDIHANFRKGHTDLRARQRADETLRWWRGEDSTMVFAFGEKAPVYIGAAVNPDGSWGIGITNYTGEINPKPHTQVRSTTFFNAGVYIEELDGKGDVRFVTHRIDSVVPHIHKLDTVVASNGRFDIRLEPMSLITMRSEPGVSSVLPDMADVKAFTGFTVTGSRPFNIRFDVPRHGMRADLSVYNLHGVKVATLVNGNVAKGTHTVLWNGTSGAGPALAAGQYICRLSTETGVHAKRVFLMAR